MSKGCTSTWQPTKLRECHGHGTSESMPWRRCQNWHGRRALEIDELKRACKLNCAGPEPSSCQSTWSKAHEGQRRHGLDLSLSVSLPLLAKAESWKRERLRCPLVCKDPKPTVAQKAWCEGLCLPPFWTWKKPRPSSYPSKIVFNQAPSSHFPHLILLHVFPIFCGHFDGQGNP